MKRSLLFVIVVLIIFSFSPARANVGVFTGYGHTIELTGSNDVQMLSEDITIIPGRGRFLFDGGVAGMDRVEYICKFILKNKNIKKVSIRAGFPLNSQFLEPPYDKKNKTSDLVSYYQFIAQEEGKIYNVEFSPGDKDKKLKTLFLWYMHFMPNETKELLVTYSMPISMTLASTAKNWKESNYSKGWYQSLKNCMIELFGYVTETGKSWSGPIEKASFRVYVKGFEDYIFNRPFMEGMNKNDREKSFEKDPVWEPLVFRIVEPDNWDESDKGVLKLTVINYKFEKNLMFYYYITSFPKTKEDAERLISTLSKGFTKEDYDDLRDIFMEYNGKKTNNKRIDKFLINQKWYGLKIQNPIPDEVFKIIEIKKR